MDTYTMGPAEGAAWRYQLDAMIRVLDDAIQDAAPSPDEAALLTALCEARAAAGRIELRGAVEPAYRGVSLAKC
jgi:hypothetical protein